MPVFILDFGTSSTVSQKLDVLLAHESACPKFAQYRVINARITQFQTEQILPINPAPHGISSLAIAQSQHRTHALPELLYRLSNI